MNEYRKRSIRLWLTLLGALWGGGNALAQDDEGTVTLSTTVTGNQEQPKVLYIVPWKSASDDTTLYQPLNSKLNNIFGHVEPQEHQREVDYLNRMNGDVEAKIEQ